MNSAIMKPKISFFLALLQELQKLDTEFPLQYAICLAEIARHQGISLTQLAQKTDMPLSTVSRIVGALSRKRQKGKPYNLVNVCISAKEKRRKELYLSNRGLEFISSIVKIIENDSNQALQS